jgi:tetratricopeptide (TPR) repeat protein
LLTLLEAWFAGEHARALESARELQRMAPRDLWTAYFRAHFAGRLNRPAEVVEALDGVIERLPPTWQMQRTLFLRSIMWAYQALGRYEEALALARRVGDAAPGEWRPVAWEVGSLAALGRLDELERAVDDCERVPGGQCDIGLVHLMAGWNLVAHGEPELGRGYALLAVERFRGQLEDGSFDWSNPWNAVYFLLALRGAELWQEYHDFAARVAGTYFAPLAPPRHSELPSASWYALCCVGMAAAHLGDRAAAEALMERFEAAQQYGFAGRVAAHLGELDLAVDYLEREVAAGSGGYTPFPPWELDLEPLWGYPPYEELARPKG